MNHIRYTYALFMMLCSLGMLSSCKKSDTSDNSNTVKSPFTIRYEISSTVNSSIADNIQYTNESSGNSILLTVPLPWTKTVTVTTAQRPFVIFLFSGSMSLPAAGKITGKIFINGVEKASVTKDNPIFIGSGAYMMQLLDVRYAVL